jgi:diacylglycerol kinase family enzyme
VSRIYHVFINDAAGSVGEPEQQVRDITDAFDAAGVVAMVEIVEPERLAEVMRAAWKQGVDAIVVAGGDGTISSAAEVAVADEMVLGVLPLGTFNHFAKDLGMTADLAAAVRFLAEAEIVPVDVGEVNGTIFINNASIGVYPTMVAERDNLSRRRGWGKVRSAPLAIVRTLRRLPVHHLELVIDGSSPEAIDTPFLFVGNGLFDERGERVGQRTTLTDHRLGVYVIATTSRWRLVANAIESRVGGIRAAAQTRRRAGETLVVTTNEPTLAIALDGEPTDLRPPLTFRSKSGALRVLAQPARDRDLPHEG